MNPQTREPGRLRPTGVNPLHGEAVKAYKAVAGIAKPWLTSGTTRRFGTKVSGGHFRRSGYLKRILTR
ncbi:hypothetical protein [Desulfosporosinus orientis]|uniref:hypothetical protein n=1 Tax=Desulfosporosinus orientis TaxID=1563 RepID=UPI0011D224C4|nr:hypothetical protein [Desulfosporosinus orientis]